MGELYNFEKIFSLLDNLSNFQKSRIPLCAAENVISNFCKLPLDGDIQERYIMGNYYTYSEKIILLEANILFQYMNKFIMYASCYLIQNIQMRGR